MKLLNKPVLTGLAALLMVGCASMTKAPSTPPSATVRIQKSSAAYYGSATTGQGFLYFHGHAHHFTIAGLGVGGMGGQKVTATGQVFNMSSLHDFPGTYRGVSQGLTLVQGKMSAKLTNEKGVVMYISGTTSGLASSGGVQSYQIKLTR